MINFEFAINITIIVLLLLVIIYAYRLNRSINILHNNQESISDLTQTLSDAAIQANHIIPKLKVATNNSAEELEKVVEKAQNARNELEFILAKTDTLATRLENIIYNSQNVQLEPHKAKETEQSPKTQPSFVEDFEYSEAEAELLKALRSIK